MPKAPLTWLRDEALTPPRAPAAHHTGQQNRVDGSRFAVPPAAPKDQVYILREDDSRQHLDAVRRRCQRGSCCRPASATSRRNIAPECRQWLAAVRNQAAAQRPHCRTSAIRLYDEVTGGTADEDPRTPARPRQAGCEELGRIVSLSDFEYEALALPGVEKALALWDMQDNVPLLTAHRAAVR